MQSIRQSSEKFSFFCHPMRFKAGDKPPRIFPIILATLLKPMVLLMHGTKDWCPLLSLSFTSKHDLFILEDKSASLFFPHSFSAFLIFLPCPSHAKTSCRGNTDMNLGRILTEHQHTMNLVQLSVINIWPLCWDSVILAGLGLVSIPSAPVSLQPINITSDGKDYQPEEFTDHFKEQKVKQSI